MPDVAHLPICAPPSCLQSCDDRADTRQHPMCLIELMVQADIQAKACVPITQHLDDCSTQTWGLLVVCSRAERQWQPAEVDLLQQISNQLAIAVHRSELYQQLQIANQELQRLATLDGLTQIANRHRFDHHLRQEWQRLMREQAPLSIILCDVDHFKRYNDTYGHLAGDNCLVEIAQAIHRAVRRPADLAARYGGEEFAIILPNTDHDGAIQIAQAIDAEMTRLNLSHISSPIANGRVTLSLGIATVLPSGDSSPAALLDRADHALYQAKAQGRNQYCVAAAVKPL